MSHPHILEYTNLELTPLDLPDRVNEYIKKGWQPYGNPMLTSTSASSRCYVLQAMVKYDYTHGFIPGE